MRILIAEDEIEIARALKVLLEKTSPAGQFERKYSNCHFKIYKNWIFITVQYSCMLQTNKRQLKKWKSVKTVPHNFSAQYIQEEIKMSQERYALNKQLAQMLKGGVIMDVTTPEQAKIAEEAGACAVMALERIPADIRAAGGVSRMSDPKMIKGIQEAVSIPVMAKCRIGHFVEAQILEAIEIDYIDESEVLSPADDVYHIDKRQFKVPFVCGAKDLGEALRRIAEGASMIRTKGEPGTGDVVQAVRHMRMMNSEIAKVVSMREDELFEEAKNLRVPYELLSMYTKTEDFRW